VFIDQILGPTTNDGVKLDLNGRQRFRWNFAAVDRGQLGQQVVIAAPPGNVDGPLAIGGRQGAPGPNPPIPVSRSHL
jgi:hypothetical protein